MTDPVTFTDRMIRAERICADFNFGGGGNEPAEIAEHRYAVVVNQGDDSRVIFADDDADLADIEIRCLLGDGETVEREYIHRVFDLDTGETVTTRTDVVVIATVNGTRRLADPVGEITRQLARTDTLDNAARACDDLAAEIVGRSHTDANIMRADRLHATAAALRAMPVAPTMGQLAATADQMAALATWIAVGIPMPASVELVGGYGGDLGVKQGDSYATISPTGDVTDTTH